MNLADGYAVVDLETTGLDCWNDLIIEIGVSVARPGKDPATDSVLVKVDRTLPPQIVRLTGISDRDLAARGITIDDALAWFIERAAGLPLIGHNIIRFDRAFLLEAARVHRRAVEEERYPRRVIDEVDDLPARRFIDTMALYKGFKLGRYPVEGESHLDYARRVLDERTPPGLRYNLQAACQDFGISTSRIRAHRAQGDVVQTQRLFEKLREAGACS
jgi:DNA polymerase III epsilon subunit-like protein